MDLQRCDSINRDMKFNAVDALGHEPFQQVRDVAFGPMLLTHSGHDPWGCKAAQDPGRVVVGTHLQQTTSRKSGSWEAMNRERPARKSRRSLAEWTVATRASVEELRCCNGDSGGMAYPLRCVECSIVSDESASGWRAYLTDDEYEPTAVATFCPQCAAREFGQRQLWLRIDDE
jgi:hypothetical protein